jgi:hypothetical protein
MPMRPEVKRAGESWNYIYIFLGFALTIEGTFIQMFNLDAVSNLVLYLPAIAVTWYLFLHDGWFHNKLTGKFARGKVALAVILAVAGTPKTPAWNGSSDGTLNRVIPP